MKRYRIHYHKTKDNRYTSNLDIHKMWERWLRRARLPISYSQGFHPQPRINQAAPLPLGMISQFEMVDIWLDEDLSVQEVLTRLTSTPQAGLPIIAIQEVDLSLPAMQAALLSSRYQIHFLDDMDEENLQEKVSHLLLQPSILRERRGKSYDLRPLLLDLQVEHAQTGELVLNTELSMQSGATGRPDEVVEALGISQEDVLIERTCLTFPSV
jgi:radical SAM-linked protein